MTEPSLAADPSLSVALALAAGMIAQAAARHLRIPGIVLLLGAGVLLGPDLLGIVQPRSLGPALQALVGFAVAVILFEGGMNLDLRRIRRAATSIRRLVSWGAMITAVGGTVAARYILRWDWTLAVLFGTLVIVTGPTVVTPLLRRIRVQRSVSTVLEAEGVLIDPIGAIIAIVALQVALSPSRESFALGARDLVLLLGFGVVAGLLAGYLIAWILRNGRVAPEGLESVFTLGLVLAVYQVSNHLLPESGIMTVTIAGLVVGNEKTHVLDDLKEFKEQLTVLFIGMLFVLLAADVRIEEITGLGWPGLATVGALMFVVRPLNVFTSTLGSGLELREKLFISWLGPRGIVAAAVASLFATELEQAGIAGGNELRALVFLVIAVTVLVQGLSGSAVAGWLGVRQTRPTGYVVLGANRLGLAFGEVLRRGGEEVRFIDSNPDACRDAEEAGFRVLFGSAIAEGTLRRAELESRAGCLAVTSNDEVNFMFARRAREDFKVKTIWVALREGHVSVTQRMLDRLHVGLLFGKPRNLDLWMVRLERGIGILDRWIRSEDRQPVDDATADPDRFLLPLLVVRNGKLAPALAGADCAVGDEWHMVIDEGRRDQAEEWLAARGWTRSQERAGPTD